MSSRLVLLYPRTRPENFVQEGFSWDEWDRRVVWINGRWYRYQTFDYFTSTYAHRGEDLHDHGAGPEIFAGIEGWAELRHDGAAFGYQVAIRDAHSPWVTKANHMSHPTPLREGQRVDPDTIVGYIGATGNVSGPHDHDTSYEARRGYGYFNEDYPAACRRMKGEIVSLKDDLIAEMKKQGFATREDCREMAVRAAREIMLGGRDTTLDPTNALGGGVAFNTRAIGEKVGVQP